MRRPIIILGMHRSGTSLTADVVRRWGASAGEQELLPPNRKNPRGYWELAALVSLNDDLLAAVNSGVFLPPSDKAHQTLVDLATSGPYRERALHLLHSMENHDRPWFWKDPRLAILLPFWKKLWGEAIFVIPIRDPIQVARSLHTWHSVPYSAGMLLWERYMVEIVRSTGNHPQRIFIGYENLVEHPEEQCRRLSSFLNRCCYDAASEVDEQTLEKMVQAVDVQLRRNKGKCSEGSRIATKSQYHLFKQLENALSSDPQDLVDCECEMREGWREYLEGWKEYLRIMNIAHRGFEKMIRVYSSATVYMRHLWFGRPSGSDSEAVPRG
ncbi:MAG: sulfotransferase family protein [Terracidiphilus sp.]